MPVQNQQHLLQNIKAFCIGSRTHANSKHSFRLITLELDGACLLALIGHDLHAFGLRHQQKAPVSIMYLVHVLKSQSLPAQAISAQQSMLQSCHELNDAPQFQQ